MGRNVVLTERFVRSLKTTGRLVHLFDGESAGFCLRVQASGSKSFCLDYSVSGRRRRLTIGRWPDWSVRQARERCSELRRMIDSGIDPAVERDADRVAPRMSDLADRYLEHHASHLAPRNAADQASMLRNLVLPHWGSMLVSEVQPLDVERLLALIAEGRARPSKDRAKSRRRPLKTAKPTPIRANRVGEVLRKMFNLSVQWKLRTDNPAEGFRRRPETERGVFLSASEITRLADALMEADDQRSAGVLRMCMLTGARLGEVRTAQFDHFNLERCIWEKPAANTKQRRVHRVPISGDVAALVRQRRVAVPRGSVWLFPGDAFHLDGTPKDQPIQDIRNFWASIQRQAGIRNVRVHDLRHTFASLLVSGGASLEMIGKLLGHSQMRTTQRYAHLADDPLRAGVDSVAAAMRSRPRVVGGTDV